MSTSSTPSAPLVASLLAGLVASTASSQIQVPSPAHPDIKTAYGLAPDGSTIHLAAGVHLVDAPLDAGGRDLRVVGAVDGTGEPASVLDGGSLNRILELRTGETAATVFENLRFTGGWADEGGAIHVMDASPMFVNCVFDSNRADQRGGAVFVSGDAATVVWRNCRFHENRAGEAGTSGGGAIAFQEAGWFEILDGVFEANHARGGGAILVASSSGLVERSGFSRNQAAYEGGGISIRSLDSSDGTTLVMVECAFDGNESGHHAGALDLFRGRAELVRCRFSANRCPEQGGALVCDGGEESATCSIVESVFAGNQGRQGGAVGNRGGGISIVDAEFTDNVGTLWGGAIWSSFGGEMVLARVMASGNRAETGSFHHQNGGAFVGRSLEVVGNESSSGKAMVFNAGNTSATLWESQVCEWSPVGGPILGPWTDLGLNCVSTECACDCPADLDADGQVTGSDFGLMIGAWGTGPGPADLDGDGQVDAVDLGILFAAWGDCG